MDAMWPTSASVSLSICRDLVAAFVHKCPEVGAGRRQTAVQRAAVHGEERRNLIGAPVIGQQAGPQDAAHLLGKFTPVLRLERLHLVPQQPTQLGLDGG
jgi:hypothetical protein